MACTWLLKTAFCKWKWLKCHLGFQWRTASHTSCRDAKQHCALLWSCIYLEKTFYKRATQEIVTCPTCLCSKSFLMCQWHQWLPNISDWLSSYCATLSATGVSLLLRWKWRWSVLCRPPLESFHYWTIWVIGDSVVLHNLICVIKAHLPSCALCFTRPCTSSGLREALAFELLSCHLLLLENKEKSREQWLTFLHPSQLRDLSIHPWDMVSAHTVISTQPSRLLSGSELDFVSKAGKHCHLDCPQRVPLPVQFLLFKIIAAFTTTLHL